MIDTIKNELLTVANLCYLLTVVCTPILVQVYFRAVDWQRRKRRRNAGLPADQLVGPEHLLDSQRTRAFVESFSILLAIILFPLVAPVVLPRQGLQVEQFKVALAVAMAGFAFSAAEVIRSYVCGLLFFTSITLARGLQVGDRATLLGHTGRITRMTPLFIQLATANDEFVTLPTKKLWDVPIVSANAGNRASLCVISFHLAPFATNAQRRTAEDAIWEAIQSSCYVDLGRRVEILVGQESEGIVLTAKAYVASTYREFEFKSDVTSAFLAACDGEHIPLGSGKAIAPL